MSSNKIWSKWNQYTAMEISRIIIKKVIKKVVTKDSKVKKRHEAESHY